jgi:hypothetical protein
LYALSKVGEIVSLDDPRLSQATAEAGMWKFYDFLIAGRAGIYFLEPYDPKRIPVLFVHGINGTPRNFTTLIAKLDRSRFQPWVVYYPSGARLDMLVTWLNELYTRLELSLRFKTAVVVAHSMAARPRGFVPAPRYQHRRSDPHAGHHLLALGGMASAGEGVEISIVVRSWYAWRRAAPTSTGSTRSRYREHRR